MDEIQRQVARARRRLNLQAFFRIVAWSLSIAFVVALIGLAIPKFWVLRVRPEVWTYGWLGGSAAVGLLAGWIITYLKRRDDLAAAIELDRRFGLKERVSSSLSLSTEERESEFGQALMHDAARRVERLNVQEQFRVGFSWRTLAPLAPLTALIVLALLVPNAQPKADASTEALIAQKQAIKRSMVELEKKLASKREDLSKKGLKEAEEALKELGKGTEKLKNADAANRKEALVKLSELSKELEKRRDALGGAEQVKKELESLKSLDQGPADKAADAMRKGDFGKAADEMKKLLEKIKNGELNKEDREKLAKQLDAIKDKLEQAAADRERKKQELKDEIAKKQEAGDHAAAAKLQDQLDKMEAQGKQMDGMMKKMGGQMGKAAQQMREGGDPKEAAEELEDLAKELQDLQKQADQAEVLDEALDEIADAKGAMGCKECDGKGCLKCPGQGKGGAGKGEGIGDGLGEGQGKGDRPEEENATKGYNSKVRNKVQKGKSTKVGEVGGPNISGRPKEEIQEQISASTADEADPIEETALPRDQRNHSREYFEKLLKE